VAAPLHGNDALAFALRGATEGRPYGPACCRRSSGIPEWVTRSLFDWPWCLYENRCIRPFNAAVNAHLKAVAATTYWFSSQFSGGRS
jgi:hypothetical protein